MKKILNKNIIFGLIIGLLMCGVGTYALNILSTDVEFNPANSEFNVNNVGSALDALYDRKTNWPNSLSGVVASSHYKGQYIPGKNASLNLTKGNYIIFVGYTFATPADSSNVVGTDHNPKDDLIALNVLVNDGMSCTQMNDECSHNNSTKTKIYNCILSYKCNVPSSGTFSMIAPSLENMNSSHALFINIDSIKLD